MIHLKFSESLKFVLNKKNLCLHSQLLVHIVVLLDLVIGVDDHCEVRLRLFLLLFFKHKEHTEVTNKHIPPTENVLFSDTLQVTHLQSPS